MLQGFFLIRIALTKRKVRISQLLKVNTRSPNANSPCYSSDNIMKPLVLLRLILYALNITFVLAAGAEKKFFGRDDVDGDNDCSVQHALHILECLSMSGESFCTSLLHKRKGATKTESFVATTTQGCSVRTETTTEHATFTTT